MKLRSLTLYVATILFAAFTLSSCNSDSSNPSDNTGNDNDQLKIPGVGSVYVFSETESDLSLGGGTKTGTSTHTVLANDLTMGGYTGVLQIGEMTEMPDSTSYDTTYVAYLPNGDVAKYDGETESWMVFPFASKTSLSESFDTVIEDVEYKGSTKLAYEKNETISAAGKSFNTSKVNLDLNVDIGGLLVTSTKGSAWFNKSVGYIVKSETTAEGEIFGIPIKDKTVMTLSSYTIK